MNEFLFSATEEDWVAAEKAIGSVSTVDEMTRRISRSRSADELRKIIRNLERGRGWEGIDAVNRERYMQCLKRSLARLEGRD